MEATVRNTTGSEGTGFMILLEDGMRKIDPKLIGDLLRASKLGQTLSIKNFHIDGANIEIWIGQQNQTPDVGAKPNSNRRRRRTTK